MNREGIISTFYQLPRISCNVDPDEFLRDYVLPGVPVMLTGCPDDWPAWREEEGWNYRGMMERYGDDVYWLTDVSIPDESPVTLSKKWWWDFVRIEKATAASSLHSIAVQDDNYQSMMKEAPVKSYPQILLNGKQVLLLESLNATVRVCEKIGSPPR